MEPGDEKIIFGCATFLLANAGFTEYIRRTLESSDINKKVITDISGAIQVAVDKTQSVITPTIAAYPTVTY